MKQRQEQQVKLVDGAYIGKSGIPHKFSNPLEQRIAEIAAQHDGPAIDYGKYKLEEHDGDVYLEGPFHLSQCQSLFCEFMEVVERHRAVRVESERRRQEHNERMKELYPDAEPSPSVEPVVSTGDTFFEGLLHDIEVQYLNTRT
jgi:hypothetical protein